MRKRIRRKRVEKSSAAYSVKRRQKRQCPEIISDAPPLKVTFHYKGDSEATPQFGLVAEEVEKVNSDLVVRGAGGEVMTVRYKAVNAMLLNKFLKEHRKVEEQGAIIAKQQKQIDALTIGLQKLTARVEAANSAPRVVSDN
jgi:hypothetical protein